MTGGITIAELAHALVAQGYSPLPLPAGQKYPPPDGFTGYRGRMATLADVQRWATEGRWDGNIAIRLPPDVIGIDVDAYKGGSIDPLEDQFGELPATTWITSRDDGSGIALFRVPAGTTLKANPAEAIEIVQHGHRYAVAPGSAHPNGGTYKAIDEASGDELAGLPDIDQLPELPWKWLEGLRAIKSQTAPAATSDAVVTFLADNTTSTVPGRLRGVQRRLDNYSGSRHDTLVEVACWAMREAAAGAYTANQATDLLEQWWRRVMDDPQRLDSSEFGDAIRWAVAQVALEPQRVEQIRNDMAEHRARCPHCGSHNVRSKP